MKMSLVNPISAISIGVPGITLHILILTTYLREWYKGRRPTACDLILSTMTFTNMILQCTMIADSLLFYLPTDTTTQKGVFLFDVIVFPFLNYTCFWQTALLSTYYCVKLFNFSHSFFQWVKKLILTATNLLLLVPAVFCFLINLPPIWTVSFDSYKNVTKPAIGTDYIVFNYAFNLFNVAFGCCLPFTLTFSCITLSVGSLLKHIWSIRRNILQLSSPPQTGGLVRAAGTMVFCALLDLLYCAVVIGEMLFPCNCDSIMEMMIWQMGTLYPTARSIVLIIGNPQLKKEMGEMLVTSWKQACF